MSVSDARQIVVPAERPAPKRENPRPAKPFYKRPLLMAVLATGVIVAVVGAVGWWLHARNFESTDDAFIDGHIVRIAPKISGYVSRLDVDDNQLVQQGDLLLELDPRDYQVALEQAQAAEASARSRLQEAKVQIAASEEANKAAEAEATAAQATAENAQSDRERNSNLVPKGAVSQKALDASIATARSTAAQMAAASARAASAAEQVRLAKSQALTAQAALRQAQAQVEQARLDLSYASISAPATVRVTRRNVERGDFIKAGQPLFALVDPRVWVTANFKETQLTEMRKGQAVEVRVDAFPELKLRAHVDSFQRGSGARFSALPAENATGNYVKVVQRVPVKIVFDEPLPEGAILGPGMSVEPTVKVR